MDNREGQGLSELIKDLNFNIAIIHLGTNDIGHRLSPSEIGNDVSAIDI